MIILKLYTNNEHTQTFVTDGNNVLFSKSLLTDGTVRLSMNNEYYNDFSPISFTFTDELAGSGNTIEDLLNYLQTCISNYKNSCIISYTYDKTHNSNIIYEIKEYHYQKDNTKPEVIQFSGTFTGETDG